MEDGGADVAGQAGQFLIALVLDAGPELLGRKACIAGCATMRRVTRSESAATWRSCAVDR